MVDVVTGNCPPHVPVEEQFYSPAVTCPDDRSVWPDFNADALYGPQGVPLPTDTRQTGIGDCGLVATLRAYAGNRPGVLQEGIQYNATSHSFDVALYDTTTGQLRVINVTQRNLAEDLSRGGASTIDDSPCKDEGALWPAVYETAFAKMLDSNPGDGLAEGFAKLDKGVSAIDAVYALSGREPEFISLCQPRSTSLGYDVACLPGISGHASRGQLLEAMYERLTAAVNACEPVVLGTGEESSVGDAMSLIMQDGVWDEHGYALVKVRKDAQGEIWIDLGNPVGHNYIIRHLEEGLGHPSANTSIKLGDLYDSGSLAAGWGFFIAR